MGDSKHMRGGSPYNEDQNILGSVFGPFLQRPPYQFSKVFDGCSLSFSRFGKAALRLGRVILHASHGHNSSYTA